MSEGMQYGRFVGRCPSRIAHESGVVLRCMDTERHYGVHVAGVNDTVRWDDEDDRVITDVEGQQ